MGARKRGGRGRAAEIYAARQGDDIDVADDENLGLALPNTEDLEEGDEPEDDDGGVIVADEPEEGDDDDPADEAEDDPIADLQAQLTALKKRTDDAEAENATLKRDNADAVTSAVAAEQVALNHALNSAMGVAKQIEADLEKAMKAGDSAGVVKAQRALTRAELAIANYEEAASELAAELEAEKRKPKTAPKPAAGKDPYLESIAHMDQRAQAWLIANRKDIEPNPNRGTRAVAGHHLAISEGIEANSPEYFEFMNEHMGYEPVKKPKAKAAPTGRPASAAPAGGRAPASNRKEVHLTRAERDIAASMGMTVQQYAKNKMEIEENGTKGRDGIKFSRDAAHIQRGR